MWGLGNDDDSARLHKAEASESEVICHGGELGSSGSRNQRGAGLSLGFGEHSYLKVGRSKKGQASRSRDA